MTFSALMQRLFSPLQTIQWTYFQGVFQAFSFFVFDIYTVYVFKILGDALQNNDADVLRNTIIVYAIIFVVFYVWKYFVRHRGWAIGRPKVGAVIRDYALQKFFGMDQVSVEKQGTGRISHIIQSGVDNWTTTLMDIQYFGVEFFVKFLFALYLVFQLGREYGVGFVVYIILGQFLMNILNAKSITRRNKRKIEEVALSRTFVRTIMSKREILLSDKRDQERAHVSTIFDNILGCNLRVNYYLFFMFNIPIFLVQGFVLVVLIQTYFSFTAGNFSFGTFTSLVAMSGYLVPLMLTSTNTFKNLTANFTNIEKMRKLFDTTPQISGYEDGEEFVYKQGNIEFDGVVFGYEGNEHGVMQDFTLTLQGGKKTALVGSSGSGKSTLVKLIAGYLRPDSGAVIVDGQDLSEVSLKSYYKHIGYLTQEPSVFDGTIRENLLYAVEGKGPLAPLGERRESKKNNSPSLAKKGLGDDYDLETRLEKAIKQANCEFIYDLPNGLDTEIGERGIRLSGGQRQRLAIAKIFLKNPEIIILDEPTSALDSFSEEAITQAMHTLFEGRTVIIIAHRLQTVKHADDIILLGSSNSSIDNKGQQHTAGSVVLERGTHDELVQQGGQYAKMLELQSGF